MSSNVLLHDVFPLILWLQVASVAVMAKSKKIEPMHKTRASTKSEMLRIRITQEQKALFQEAADAEALDLGAWLRQTGVKAARGLLGK